MKLSLYANDMVLCVCVCVCVCVSESCLSLWSYGCSLPGSSVHGILQTKILEWVAISFSRESSLPRDWTQVSCIVGRFFPFWATSEALDTSHKNSKDCKQKLLELISRFDKVSEHKINIQKYVVFLYTNNEISKSKETIPFKVCPKNQST